ncbi:MAG: heat shock protein [Mycoplasmataceae bacterium RC_NB112A]|nr:MAG: heat shock protein [Mycoplasmataceae bacterium RC_NB112A]KLL02249.1 MAG: heat shock protein [Mycoplasmataceae bacterium RC_NB112A]
MNSKEKAENPKKTSKVNPKAKIIPPLSEEIEKLKEKEQKITQLEAELAEIKKWKEENLHELADQVNRLREMEEYKKIEIIEIERYGKQKLLAKIVDFLINLESQVIRTMREHLDPQGIIKSQADGIEITLDNLKKDLEKEGLHEMKIKLGIDLRNPKYHKSLGEVTDKKLPVGTITEVIKKGYLLHERVLRYAEVKTSKK